MSQTLPQIRARTLVEIRQADNLRNSFGVVEVDQTIRNVYLSIQSRLPAAHAYVDSAGTIVAAADTFTLPTSTSTIEYAGDVRIRLQSNRRFLKQLRVEELDALREGTSTSAVSIPYAFSMYEEDDQEVQCRCYPRSQATETYDLYRSLVAADFDLTALDSTSIKFSRYAGTVLVLKSAARLVKKMTPKQLEVRDLNPEIAADWDADAERMLYQEGMRRNRISSAGRMQRWLV